MSLLLLLRQTAAASVGIALATAKAEISWSAAPRGSFVLNTSALDSTATLGISAFDDAFGGPYDDITPYLDEITIESGRSDDIALLNESSCTLVLRDRTGLFSAENPASPLYSDIAARLHPVRVSMTVAGTTYRQFYGWARRIRWQPRRRSGYTTIECVDLLYWLRRTSPTIAATGPTTVGAAIGLILDAVGWIDPAMRSIATGDPIANFSADGSKTALTLIQELLDFERGVFWVSGSGVATYETRHARALKLTAGTIANEMQAVGPGVDADRVRTKVTVTRTGGVPQVVEDAAAANLWGPSDGDSIVSSYLASDAQAAELGNYVISQTKSPRSPLRSLEFDGRTTALLTQLLAREFGDKVTVTEAAGGTAGSFHVEQRRLKVSAGSRLVEGSWIVSRASANTVFVVDTSALDSGAVVAY
ncbi:hypothetical protein Gocc_2917 [Gaiella occulta]|uniref:Phage tail protein n=1 Tax=Gaiella occulta TaxID=1002870 RepID=A0A7M2YV14_9ACTN|nr:hypothetical protein [Gaiella occulta]RDI73317.1 hypothetical protein Gocc_2917 [Gaiella occulta]